MIQLLYNDKIKKQSRLCPPQWLRPEKSQDLKITIVTSKQFCYL